MSTWTPVNDKVWSGVWDQTNVETDVETNAQVWDWVYDQVWHQIETRVDPVFSQVREQSQGTIVRNQTREALE